MMWEIEIQEDKKTGQLFCMVDIMTAADLSQGDLH